MDLDDEERANFLEEVSGRPQVAANAMTHAWPHTALHAL